MRKVNLCNVILSSIHIGRKKSQRLGCLNCFNNCFSVSNFSHESIWTGLKIPTPDLEESYYCDSKNKDEIIKNILSRKGVGDIEKVLQLHEDFLKTKNKSTKDLLLKEMLRMPNRTHPDVLSYGENPKVIQTVENKRNFGFKPKLFHDIAKSMNLLRNDVSNLTGHRSYFFVDQLAQLESAMLKYSVFKLIKAGFQLISVPDILHRSIIESCGMETRGKRSQVYCLSSEHGNDKCLSGTSEIALASYLMGKELSPEQLPLRLAAVSRCYRAETSRTSDERGIYRVHQFTKVEMFGVCEPSQSGALLDEFRKWQMDHFSEMELELQLLDMPAHELGAQAYRKYDVEAWLPAKKMWAELSSCSDCTDYQSRRLAIRSGGKYVHTVNGTACAAPRLIIALFEQHQQRDGTVTIPPPLRSYMGGAMHINKNNDRNIPVLRLMKRLGKKS